MSTKIYCAYRFPLLKVEEGIRVFHDTLMEGALEHFTNALDRLNLEVYNRNVERNECLLPKTKEFQSYESKYYALQDLTVRGDHFTKQAWDNMSCGFNSWIYDGYMYIIPWGSYNVSKYLPTVEDSFPEWIEEFGYWNNTDPPEEFAREEGWKRWQARGELWKKVGPGGFNPGFWAGRLVHEAVDFTRFTGTEELMKLFRKRNNLKDPWE